MIGPREPRELAESVKSLVTDYSKRPVSGTEKQERLQAVTSGVRVDTFTDGCSSPNTQPRVWETAAASAQ